MWWLSESFAAQSGSPIQHGREESASRTKCIFQIGTPRSRAIKILPCPSLNRLIGYHPRDCLSWRRVIWTISELGFNAFLEEH